MDTEADVHKVVCLAAQAMDTSASRMIGTVPLFSCEQSTIFARFLVEKRIIPFLKMKIVEEYKEKFEYISGYESVSFWKSGTNVEWGGEGDQLLCSFGPAILRKPLTWEEFFGNMVTLLGIDHVRPSKTVLLNDLPFWDGQNERSPGPKEFSTQAKPIMVGVAKDGSGDFIAFTDSDLYYSDAKVAADAFATMALMHDFFDGFLKAKSNSSVPHTMYLDWLVSWFPSLVKVNVLES